MKKRKTKKRKGYNIPGMKSMRCPYCGSAVHLRSADGIYKDNSKNAKLYVCSKYPECDAYVRVHDGTTVPMGSLADGKLRNLRILAHRHFDKLYETGLMSKTEAYRWLAATLQSPVSHAHIGHLSEYYCNYIISESRKFFERYKYKLHLPHNTEPITGGESRAAQ